jgi:ABC-2 type transport system permease protein
MVATDFKVRYQGSMLGYLWSLLKPLFLFAILYIVFTYIIPLGKAVEHYPVYLLTGIVLWNFFTEATMQGLQSIVGRGDLIRKINFPKYIIVISGTISALINLCINMAVVIVFCLINGVELRPEALLVIPLILELYVFSLAISFLLSAMNARYRDVGYLWEIFLQAAFYATPILYPLQTIMTQAPWAAKWLLINPVAQVIQDIRYVLVTTDTITIWSLVHNWKVILPFAIIAVTGIAGSIFFKKKQKYFAEEI